MQTNLEIEGGRDHVRAQVLRHLRLLHEADAAIAVQLDEVLPEALARTAVCWAGIDEGYFVRDGRPYFNPDHSNQYCQFLLILARAAAEKGHRILADRVFGVNKMMNGCDIYHAVKLPSCFCINHSVGLVLGRAMFGERLYLSQNCTVGGNPGETDYPVLGDDNFLMANVMIAGRVKTGNRVLFAAGACVINQDIPDDSIVFGRSPDIVVKPLSPEAFRRVSYFRK